ncbi:hypothetical protein G9A89_021184 [Geosiphon pyriformis]|nr:hypothetical protein G9A89_021184 [Geosiphon pyriformis]
MKQRETDVVTTYLRCFYQNLRQIQAIDANYFTASQILNQFIRGLRSSIFANLSTNGPNLLATAIGNVSTTTANNLSTPNDSDSATKLTGQRSPKAENHAAKLEIVNKDISPSNQEPTQKQQTCTSNIPPTTVTNNELLDAIFPFELEELSNTPLFSGATLEEKPITAMYTDAKINGHHIKLILDNSSADSIIT